MRLDYEKVMVRAANPVSSGLSAHVGRTKEES